MRKNDEAKIGIAVFAIVAIISTMLGAVLWPYTINTWLVIAGKAPSVVWWQGALLGFVPVIGQLTVPLAALTFIATLFI